MWKMGVTPELPKAPWTMTYQMAFCFPVFQRCAWIAFPTLVAEVHPVHITSRELLWGDSSMIGQILQCIGYLPTIKSSRAWYQLVVCLDVILRNEVNLIRLHCGNDTVHFERTKLFTGMVFLNLLQVGNSIKSSQVACQWNWQLKSGSSPSHQLKSTTLQPTAVQAARPLC